ncbi:hypothetical protein [Kushneria avicenniae]|uniref:hypothetical protein n=1 Tax=Kushneria avicenniae TaxID=402385 RepID=UPI001113868B|nr:hypothetical protein [Kushneria avicenniae]
MQEISWVSAAFYCAFNIFVFYQRLHIKNFGGSSQAFLVALNISAFTGMLTGLGYLIYYGWSVVWWAPVLIFGLGFLASMLSFFVERIFGPLVLSLSAFIGWPVCAFLMFQYVPLVN